MRAWRILVAIAFAGLIAFVGAAVLLPSPRTPPSPGTVDHERLEADRFMTQRMVVDVGPGMGAQMPAQGMLDRSADPAYPAALEAHVGEVERMLGRTP